MDENETQIKINRVEPREIDSFGTKSLSPTAENREKNQENNGDFAKNWMRVSSSIDEISINGTDVEDEVTMGGDGEPIEVPEEGGISTEGADTLRKKRLMAIFPILLSIGSAIFFTMMQLLVKMVSETNSTFQITFFRSVIQGLFAAAFLWYQEKTTPFHVERKFLWTLISRGTIGFASSWCLFFSLGKLPLSEAVVISYVHPVFVAILAAIFLKESWSLLDAFGTVLSLMGVVFIARPPFIFPQEIVSEIDSKEHWIGLTAVLLHAVLASCAICLIRSMGTGINALQNVAWFSIASIVYAGIGMLTMGTFHIPQGIEWIQLLALGCLAFGGQFCMSKALQLEKAAIVASIGYIQVAFSVVNDIVFFNNMPKMWSLLGVFLICSWAVITLLKQWFKEQKIPWFTKLRLKLMGRSTSHQIIPLENQSEMGELPKK
eukprot:TRINITY_DN5999_c0_g1_i1.p1 TRINITY_DN5999_c0_g1~~TRINITY_DN5999_c0_g1_i1.p1  ORF type:complete len:434 (+),score=99.01 TRINITY_DN5999_c0_g1_i1:114-1415(+)